MTNVRVDEPAAGRTPLLKVETFIESASQQNRKLDKTAIKMSRLEALSGLRGLYGPIWEATTPDVSGNIEAIEAVPDPIHRFIMISEAAKLGWMHNKDLIEWRRKRRSAILTLYWIYEWGRTQIIDHIGASRRQKRIVDNSVKRTDRRSAPDIPVEKAAKEAKAAHGVIAGRVALHEWAVPKRDTMIVDLTEGRYADDGTYITDEQWEAGVRGHKWPNAVLARLAKLTTAAVSQYRTGVAGHAEQYRDDNAA